MSNTSHSALIGGSTGTWLGPIASSHVTKQFSCRSPFNIVLISFLNVLDAQRVIAMGSVPFIDQKKTEITFRFPKEDDPRTLILRGFKATTNEETIKLLLESKRRGGGIVTKFQYNKVKRQAVVTYEDPEGVFVCMCVEGISLTSYTPNTLVQK